MQVNGAQIPLDAPMTVQELLDKLGYRISRIVVERNLEIIPREQYQTLQLQEDDVIEIVSFMGGGC